MCSKIKCELCNKEFHQITCSHLRKFHNIELSEYKEKFPFAPIVSEMVSNKISESAKELNNDGIIGFKNGHKINEGLEPWNKGKVGLQESWCKGLTKESCESLRIGGEKCSATRKKMYLNGELIPRIGELNPMFGKKISDKHKLALWSGWRGKMSKPEKYMWDFIKHYSDTNDWLFVGDGQFIIQTNIQTRIPDFVNVKEQKIIEVYGDYWHRGANSQSQIDEYKEVGWDCIIIWEHEILDKNYNNTKTIDFIKGDGINEN